MQKHTDNRSESVSAPVDHTSLRDDDLMTPVFSLAGVITKVRAPVVRLRQWWSSRLPNWQQMISPPKVMRSVQLGLISSLLSLAVLTWYSAQETREAAARVQLTSDLVMHSQRLAKAAPNAIQGHADAFAQLSQSRSALEQGWQLLHRGGTWRGMTIPPAEPSVDIQLAALKTLWAPSAQSASRLLELESALTGFRTTLAALNKLDPVLLELAEQVANAAAQTGAGPREIAAASQLVMLTQRLGKSANEFLTPEGINQNTAFLMARDANTFSDIVTSLLEGNAMLRLSSLTNPDARSRLMTLQQTFVAYREALDPILNHLASFIAAKEGERQIFNDNEALRARFEALQQSFEYEVAGDSRMGLALWGAGSTSVLCAVLIGFLAVNNNRRRAEAADDQRLAAECERRKAIEEEQAAQQLNRQTQAAILQLMNELRRVADGDLTVRATVSEEVTGAIADSVNYTLEELCVLLNRARQTAQNVQQSSRAAQQISEELLSLTAQQAEHIRHTGETVLRLTGQIHQVAHAASESADVAQASVSAARRGEETVRSAVENMHQLRMQIQETAKRIKRLGESSLEIGDITELISGITEQTQVLALNAAIQAAAAGESGRGFAVVAEEVQRLAERCAESVRQIGALIKIIQEDAQEAVSAMERSTQGVVNGGRLADDAGAALADIARVSGHLAALIQGISASATEQSTLANSVASHIRNILALTEHTQHGTQQTAQAIQSLDEVAEDLNRAMARFTVTV